MPPRKQREHWRAAAAIRFDPQPGPPPLRCPFAGCNRPTYPDREGGRDCIVHGEARRELPPEYIELARLSTANWKPSRE